MVVTINAINMELGEMNTKLNVNYRVISNQLVNPGGTGYGRAKMLEPQAYRGERDAKELKNFVFDLEQ